tara:strand:- start:190 stop:2556 length:2367 start_codon:yes stop_codon:yes gene_type:complete
MADNTTKILLLVVILVVLGYAYQQNSGVGIIGVSGEPAEKAAEKIVNRDCSGTEYIVQKPCSRNGVVLDGLTDETSGAGFETQVLDKNHEGFVRQLGDGVCPPKLVECNVDPPKPCSGNTWLDALCVRLDADGNEVVLEDGNADACGDGIIKQRLDTSAADYKPATKGGSCTFEKSGACQKTCPEPQPPVCNYPVLGWQYNDLGCVKSQDDLTPAECGETGVIQRYKASTMNTEYCKNLTEWVSCTMKPCPQDCEGSWSDWTPNPDACDVQPSESRIYSITKPAVGNTQFGYGKPCEEIHDKVETRSRQDPIQPCCTQNHDWAPAFSAHGGTCKPDGTGIYAQTTIGNCPDDVKSAYKACCWESGDWKDVGECQMNGKQKQVQATNGNCLESVKTREVDCCWKNEWTNVGVCNSNGEQAQSRIVAGSCEAVSYPKDPDTCAAVKEVGKEGVKGVRYVWFGYAPGTGRFAEPDNCLNIAEIEVYSGGVNIVKNKGTEEDLDFWGKVKRGSNYGNTNYGVDKLFDGVKTGDNMFHSGCKPGDYFQVDLGKEYTIEEVKVFNRERCGHNNHCNRRWEGAVLKLLDSGEKVIKEGDPVNSSDTDNGNSKTYRFAISPDTLAKLEDILDVVPEDLSTMSNNTWMQVEPACALGDPVDESNTSRTVPCLYVGEWDRQWGTCNGSKRYKHRTVKNGHLSPTGSPPSTRQEQNCKHCRGYWRQEYANEHHARRNGCCGSYRRHNRERWHQFYVTQNAYNGGRGGCPTHGTQKERRWEQGPDGNFDRAHHNRGWVNG